MSSPLTDSLKQSLTTIFARGAEDASRALSKWLGRDVRLDVNGVDEIDLSETAGLLGPDDQLVASCSMDLLGRLSGQLLMIFQDRAGLALADILLRRPIGTATLWDELERSAANETANIVGCAYLNSLAAHLPPIGPGNDEMPMIPSPPTFRHEFAASLLEFALMDQAMQADRLILIRTRFTSEATELHWSLLFAPSVEALQTLTSSLKTENGR